jgi:hypothetical protein
MGSMINGLETPTVVAVEFYSTDYGESQYEIIFTLAMRVLAIACVGVKNPDLLLLQNEIVADVVVSSQCFFEDKLNSALSQIDMGLTVSGVGVSGAGGMIGLIKGVYPGSRYQIPFWKDRGCDLTLFKVNR